MTQKGVCQLLIPYARKRMKMRHNVDTERRVSAIDSICAETHIFDTMEEELAYGSRKP